MLLKCPGTIWLHDCFTRLSSWSVHRYHLSIILHIIITWRYAIILHKILTWRYAIICGQVTHSDSQQSFSVPPNCDTSVLKPIFHKFSRATQLWHVCFKANFSQVFLVPPNCDTCIFSTKSFPCHPFVTRVFSNVQTWSETSLMGTVFVPRLFTQNSRLRSKFVVITSPKNSVFTE